MKEDNVAIFRVGNDGGYQNIGTIQPPVEVPDGLPIYEVSPIVHSAATFNQAGDLFVLAYRTKYQSSADFMTNTALVDYHPRKLQ